MKITTTLLVILCLSVLNRAYSQAVNWASLENTNTHLLHANAGLEHGVVYGLGYGYHANTKIPLVFNIEYSIPSGKNLFDDFKIRLGIQTQWFNYHNFRFSTKVNALIRRRHESTTVTLFNLGTDASAVIGYYKPNFFIAAEGGFDKAIATHFKHSMAYRDNFPSVVDGWYKPGTGGNLYYGLQAGYSSKKHELYIRFGKMVAEDLKAKLQVPLYGQLGYILKR